MDLGCNSNCQLSFNQKNLRFIRRPKEIRSSKIYFIFDLSPPRFPQTSRDRYSLHIYLLHVRLTTINHFATTNIKRVQEHANSRLMPATPVCTFLGVRFTTGCRILKKQIHAQTHTLVRSCDETSSDACNRWLKQTKSAYEEFAAKKHCRVARVKRWF